MKTVSACTQNCPDSCSCIVHPDKRKVSGNPEHPYTRGVVCSKVANFFTRLDATERITTPLMRKGDSFAPTDWDTALALCAQKIDALRATPDCIAHLHGHGYRGVFANAGKAFFAALGSRTMHGSICDEAGTEAMRRCCGSLMTNDPQDLLNARRIVNWGRDLKHGFMHMGMTVHEARKRGTKLLTIDITTDTEQNSDEHICILPGTDRFLAAAVIKLYVESGLQQQGVINRTGNWPLFRGLVESWSLEALCTTCGVSTEEVEMLFDWYEQPGAVATLVGWGLQRYLYGGQNVQYIASLGMLAGHIGRKGGGVYMSFSSGRNLTPWQAQTKGPVPENRRTMLAPNLAEELTKATPALQFIWIDGLNPVNQIPNSTAIAAALKKCPFTVVVEGFMNDTALCADLILPPAYMFERDEVVGSSTHNFVNFSRKVVEAPGECLDIYDILADLGERLHEPIHFPSRGKCISTSLENAGISLEELSSKGFSRSHWPLVAYEGMRFDHPDKKFCFPETLEFDPTPNPKFPLQMLTLLRGEYTQSQIPKNKQQGLPTLYVSPHNPALKNLAMDQPLFMVSPAGRLQIRIEIKDNLHSDVVLFPRGGWMKYGQNPNPIIEPMITDMGETPAYYSQYIRLENGN